MLSLPFGLLLLLLTGVNEEDQTALSIKAATTKSQREEANSQWDVRQEIDGEMWGDSKRILVQMGLLKHL